MAAKFLDFWGQHVAEPTHKRKGSLDLIITRASPVTNVTNLLAQY